MFEIFTRVIGQCQTNCYMIRTDGGDIMIDPGDDTGELLDFAESLGAEPKYILLTHGHFDHTLGAHAVKEAYGSEVWIGAEDAPALYNRDVCMVLPIADTPFTPMQPDGLLGTGRKVFCGAEFEILKTPGHTPGGISLYCEKENVLFSGDTLFAHGYGRTDFPGGSAKELVASLKHLLSMPGDTMVYPGHYESALISEIRKGYSL